jgi:hypothetical protein
VQGDADGDRDVDGADFLAWQRQLGGATAVTAGAAVPEPASLVLIVMSWVAVRVIRESAEWPHFAVRTEG